VDGDAENTALEVPERDVDDAEQPDRKLLGAVELPDSMPELLASFGSLADELVAEDAVDDVGQHRPAPLVVGLADRALVSRNSEDCGGTSLCGAPKTPAPGERRRDGGEVDQVDVDTTDPHVG
jgi:hypothetical protein